MNQPIDLSLEQQFALRSFSDTVSQMSEEQARSSLLWLYEQWIAREQSYSAISGNSWNVELPNL